LLSGAGTLADASAGAGGFSCEGCFSAAAVRTSMARSACWKRPRSWASKSASRSSSGCDISLVSQADCLPSLPPTFTEKQQTAYSHGIRRLAGRFRERNAVGLVRRRRTCRSLRQRIHMNAAFRLVEPHMSFDQREDRVVPTEPDIPSRTPFRPPLPHNDIPRNDQLTAEFLYAEPLALAVAPVFDGPLAFFVCHISKWK